MEEFDYSIAICTFNRYEFLKICLRSIESNQFFNEKVNVVIIDNGSSDNTPNIIHEFPWIKYCQEKNTGLSNARNKAISVVKTKWIVFLDDDCMIHENFFPELSNTIKNYSFDAFTGIFIAWHYFKRPKWVSENFGNMYYDAKSIGELGHKEYVAGGNMALKLDVFKKVGMFSSHLGMQGQKIGYGEETELIKRMQRQGFRIGINPFLKIHHLVRKEKYSLKWQLTQFYAKGEANTIIEQNTKSYLYLILEGLQLFIRSIIYSTYSLVIKKNYFFKNWIFDNLKYIYLTLGKIKGRNKIKKLPQYD